MGKFFLTFFLIILFFFFPSKSFAEEYFTTEYNVTYDVLESGQTHVTFNIRLTNTSSQYYAASYKIELGFSDIENLRVSDPDGKIQPEIANTDSGKELFLEFNKKVVGIGNTLPFIISFDTNEIVQKQGSIWEINIPGLSNPEKFSDFIVSVRVPSSFGQPMYIKPPQLNKSLVFNKEQLQKSGISIAFGQTQNYSFTLLYHLQNKNLFPIQTEIAIPPDTNYQKIYLDSIAAKPTQVTQDRDGNWLAQYYLLPSEKKEVLVRGVAVLSLYPKPQSITKAERTVYLQQKKYWEVNNKNIKALAEKLKTPENIYNYLVKNLKYDYSRLTDNQNRLGAAGGLKNPNSAVCLEFTDLFVALARAGGIPAREVDGFAFTQNSKQRPLSLVKDVLHAWPEYYDDKKKTWIMVDPTWGNTTGGVDYFNVLDFDHFAFTIKGAESDYPVPAGGYKFKGHENDKDVQISFAKDFVAPENKFEVTTSLPARVIAGLPIKGLVKIRNTGQGFLPLQEGIVEAKGISPSVQKIDIPQLPPYGYVTVPVTFEKTSFLTNKKAAVTIAFGQNQIQTTISITPFFLSALFIGGLICVATISVAVFIVTRRARRISVQKSEQPNSIHR